MLSLLTISDNIDYGVYCQHARRRNKLIFAKHADEHILERWIDVVCAAEMEKHVIPYSALHGSCLGRK